MRWLTLEAPALRLQDCRAPAWECLWEFFAFPDVFVRIAVLYLFEDFELREEDFSLSRSGQRISLEPKSLRVLLLLVSRAGHLVDKQCLLDTVWAGAFVGENNLARAVAVL